jgi:hypothetical protein
VIFFSRSVVRVRTAPAFVARVSNVYALAAESSAAGLVVGKIGGHLHHRGVPLTERGNHFGAGAVAALAEAVDGQRLHGDAPARDPGSL